MVAAKPYSFESHRYNLTLSQYDRAVEAGLVGDVELLNGTITMAGAPLPITVEWLRRAVDVGVIDEEARVELLNGELIAMTPTNPPHSSTVRRLSRYLHEQLSAAHFTVLIQMPIELGELSRPEPDLTIAKGAESDYETRDPTAADVLLVIEVANTSLVKDRVQKLPIYAKAGIRESWIVNLPERALDVYRDPHLGRYQWTELLTSGFVTPSEPMLSNLSLDLGALF